jgi:hypothetical protein
MEPNIDQAMEIALKRLLLERSEENKEENVNSDNDPVINFLTRKYDELPNRENIAATIDSHLEF